MTESRSAMPTNCPISRPSLVAQGVRLVAGGDVDGWEIVAQLMATVVFCVMWRKYSLAVRRDYFYGSVLRRSRTWKDTD